MYSKQVQLEAELLYLKGYSINQIVTTLQKKYPKLSHNTVTKWATTPDQYGKTWEDYKNQTIQQARELTHKNIATRYAEIKTKAEIIKQNLEETLLANKFEIKSVENAIYAWKGLAEFILLIEEKYETKRTPKEIVLEFLDILNTVPQIKDVLRKHWNLVEEELKRRLTQEWKHG